MNIQLKGRRDPLFACGLAILLATSAATPSLAGTVYGSAVEADGFTHLFTIGHAGPGRITDQDGPISIAAGGLDTFPLNAMVGQAGHLVVTSSNSTLQYHAHLIPDLTQGGDQQDTGYTEIGAGGPQYTAPITGLAALGGKIFGTTWNDTFNTIFTVSDAVPPSAASGTVNDQGILLEAQGSNQYFGLQLDTLASFGGDLYGTGHVLGADLIFRIVADVGDPHYHPEDISFIHTSLGGPVFGIPLSAMVGTDTGLQGVAWNPLGFNEYFDLTVNGAAGAHMTSLSILDNINDQRVSDKVTALGFLPDAQLPGGGNDPPLGGVPEPATWALMLAGFGLAGAALRRRTPQRA